MVYTFINTGDDYFSMKIDGKCLSELSPELEKAGKTGNAAIVTAHHAEGLELYAKTVQEGLTILETIG